MRVRVEAEGLLPGDSSTVLAFDGPCAVREVIQQLPLAHSTGLMILVNGKFAQWETALGDGDVVELIPALGGG